MTDREIWFFADFRGTGRKVRQVPEASSRRWWRNSDQPLNTVLTIALFDRLGLPRLSGPDTGQGCAVDLVLPWRSGDYCSHRQAQVPAILRRLQFEARLP